MGIINKIIVSYMNIQNNYIILIYDKFSLIIIHIMGILVINIF